MGSDEVALAYQKAGPEGSKAPRKKEHKVKVSKNLTPLIGMDGCKFSMTEDRTPMSISSVNSKKLKKLANEHKPVNLINYHKFHFTRIYPHALKVNSDNFNPVKPWVMGSQIVALNMQTNDLPMLINFAWF